MSVMRHLESALGYRFESQTLLLQALTHSSYGHEHQQPDNERLEFLGDAVLQMCATLLLVAAFPKAREGELSRLRSRLVNTDVLAEIGAAMALGECLRLGRGEADTGGRKRTRNLANGTEALLGAVYEDAGFAACQALVGRWMTPRISHLRGGGGGKHKWKDPRSRLQEFTQSQGGHTPSYDVIARSGPPHAPQFTVAALVDGDELGRGCGGSKRTAARAAAEDALRRSDLHSTQGQTDDEKGE